MINTMTGNREKSKSADTLVYHVALICCHAEMEWTDEKCLLIDRTAFNPLTDSRSEGA